MVDLSIGREAQLAREKRYPLHTPLQAITMLMS